MHEVQARIARQYKAVLILTFFVCPYLLVYHDWYHDLFVLILLAFCRACLHFALHAIINNLSNTLQTFELSILEGRTDSEAVHLNCMNRKRESQDNIKQF